MESDCAGRTMRRIGCGAEGVGCEVGGGVCVVGLAGSEGLEARVVV